MIKKYLTIALYLTLAFSLFAGCQSQSFMTDTEAAGSESGGAVVGQITAINGDQITLALGTLNIGDMPDGSGSSGEDEQQNGNGVDAAATATAGGESQPDKQQSSGDANSGGRPGGEAPNSGSGNGPGGMDGGVFTASGEEMTITVTDDTAIMLAAQRGPGESQNESGSGANGSGSKGSSEASSPKDQQSAAATGSLSDLKIGNIITVTLSGNTASTIIVEPSRGPDDSGNGFGNQADGTT